MGQRAAASGCFQPALQDFSSLPGSSCRKGSIPTVFRRFHPEKQPRAGPAQGCHSDRKRNAGSGGPPPSHLKSLQQLGGKRPRQLPDRKPDIADAASSIAVRCCSVTAV